MGRMATRSRLIMMVVSAILPVLYFRRKGWL